MLAICFNRDELDPKSLWDRISTGIDKACTQVDNGDLDELINLALAHVRADHARVASDAEVSYFIGDITEQDESWRLGFVRYLKTHSYVAVVHGRRLWETRKEVNAESRKEAENV